MGCPRLYMDEDEQARIRELLTETRSLRKRSEQLMSHARTLVESQPVHQLTIARASQVTRELIARSTRLLAYVAGNNAGQKQDKQKRRSAG
jgi:hypothetical protein